MQVCSVASACEHSMAYELLVSSEVGELCYWATVSFSRTTVQCSYVVTQTDVYIFLSRCRDFFCLLSTELLTNELIS